MMFVPDAPAPAPRRWKVLRVSPEELIGLCQTDGRIRGEGMPKDARFVFGRFDEVTRQIQLIIESDTFEEIIDGRSLPDMNVMFKRFYE